MISIILPVYNQGKYISKALKSILSQTFSDYEVIIINDGSTDDISEKINHFLYQLEQSAETMVLVKRFKYYSQLNQGVSIARNNGVKKASFKLIAFLDADDWWEPDYLQNMLTLINQYPDAGIYGCGYYKVKHGKYFPAQIGVEKNFIEGEINYFQVYAKTLWMPLWTGATIVKKSIFFEFNGFNPKLKLGEDFFLWSLVASKYPVVFLNKQLSYYNQDVDIEQRSAGTRLYETYEHVLFSSFDHNLIMNSDFVFLYERLSLYGLFAYYLNNKHSQEIKQILDKIDFTRHELKYTINYNILPKFFLRYWYNLLGQAAKFKNCFLYRI